MSATMAELFRRGSSPLEPLPTGQVPSAHTLHGIRAVLFDVYGTLIISASGDVHSLAGGRAAAIEGAFAALGLDREIDGAQCSARLVAAIGESHSRDRDAGLEYPEVEIRQVWREVLAKLEAEGELEMGAAGTDVERLAVEYELRVNPVWPMPGARACLTALAGRDLALGVISNAQFFTLAMLEGLLGGPLGRLFDARLQLYSFVEGRAKPDLELYRRASEVLTGRGIAAPEVLYVGNDMLNDIWPAARIGFRTALFAGDARSLRLRDQDPRIRGVVPDLVLTRLDQLEARLDP